MMASPLPPLAWAAYDAAMAEIINLRLARKAKARDTAEKIATANRAKFGATKGERQIRAAQEARLTRIVDGARLEKD
jgi:hypothetical protein